MSGPVIAAPVVPAAHLHADRAPRGQLRGGPSRSVHRFAVFRALAEQLQAAPLVVDTPYGNASAHIGLVTAVS